MSAVQVAVLPGGAGRAVMTQPAQVERAERTGVQVIAFAALGLYGVLRWGTLLGGGSEGRLMGLLALGIVLAAAGPILAGWSRWLAGLLFFVAVLAGLAISGLPVSWIVHARLAVSGQAIGQGLSTLPEISVPYAGLNDWVRVTIIMGAALLLLDAALVLTFVPRRLGQLRLAGAALPLMALSVIPATAIRPGLAYAEGVLLFGLLVAFVWAQRIERRRLGGVIAMCGLAAAIAGGLAPSLDRHRAWIDYRSLANSLAPGGVETFNWTQGYGPLHWPHSGRAVMEVKAQHPDYWKAENLDVFNGHGWVAAAAPEKVPWQTGVSRSSLDRWTQTIQVTMDSLATSSVIAAGSAYSPEALSGGAVTGTSPGTWQSAHRMGPGASYRVRAYAPHPSPAQLAAAGSSYPAVLERGYLSLTLPDRAFPIRVDFPSFSARLNPNSETGTTLAASPYQPAYALAQRLKARAATPYQYVRQVESYLSHGYRYSQTPPTSQYPLESFLFVHKLGYCQHFAGAMALLLRMGGVPARVAVGFTTGSFDSATRRWVVSDLGAHAWVEAWFPRYGWVRFDPTPGVDPALKDNRSAASAGPGGGDLPVTKAHHRQIGGGTAALRHGGTRSSAPSGSDVSGVVLGALLAVMLVLGLALTRVRSGQDPVMELTRAFARTGRPLDLATTLSRLEGRLAHAPDACAYVRTMRMTRFGPSGAGDAGVPETSLKGRRALRRALGAGLGASGRVRAWWALPPRWRWPGAA